MRRMANLSAKDVDGILEISGLAQECAGASRFPAVLFQRMTELFGSKSAVFYSMGDNLGNAAALLLAQLLRQTLAHAGRKESGQFVCSQHITGQVLTCGVNQG